MSVPRELLETAVALRSVSPELWERFLHAMRAYAAGAAADMIRVDQAMLPRAQGMAIAAHEISTALMRAPDELERLKGKVHGEKSTAGSGY